MKSVKVGVVIELRMGCHIISQYSCHIQKKNVNCTPLVFVIVRFDLL